MNLSKIINDQTNKFNEYMNNLKFLDSELNNEIKKTKQKQDELDQQFNKLEVLKNECVDKSKGLKISQNILDSKVASVKSLETLAKNKSEELDKIKEKFSLDSEKLEMQREYLNETRRKVILNKRQNQLNAKELEIYEIQTKQLIKNNNLSSQIKRIKMGKI